MAAFTTFDETALRRYLVMFGVGELESFEPISDGIENSNYFITVNMHGEQTDFVLTIMEYLSFDDMPFFSSLMRHLSHFGLPVAAPRQTLDGMTSTIFCGKPTLLLPRLAGAHLTQANADHCRTLGGALADIHGTLATQDLHRDNPYSHPWMERALDAPDIDGNDRRLLARIVADYELAQELDLPRGIIHGDLFRDNVLFDQGELTGILDFYHACDDFLIQDIAICINDWCRLASGEIDIERRDALLLGYESRRALTSAETDYLPLFQKFAAARFALTRLLSGETGPYLKDPAELLTLLRYYDAGPG